MRFASPTQKKGHAIERAAEAFLVARGLAPVARSVHCRLGELDLVMRERDVIVFVEVRYRATASHGGALGSIDARKQRRIANAARWYLSNRSLAHAPCRFDVVVVEGEAPHRYEWLRAAFEPG